MPVSVSQCGGVRVSLMLVSVCFSCCDGVGLGKGWAVGVSASERD